MQNTRIIIKIATFVMIAIGFLSIAKLEMQYNDLETKNEMLQKECDDYEDALEELNREYAAEFNDDYVIKIAKNKLNLCLPEEIIFYTNLSD